MEDMIMAIAEQWGYVGIAVLIAHALSQSRGDPHLRRLFDNIYKTKHMGRDTGGDNGLSGRALVLYFAGWLLGRERLLKFLDGRAGRLLHFKKEDVELTLEWFSKKGKAAVFFCRCIPILRSLISIPAGMSGMAIGPFMVMTTAGTLVWNIVLVHMGAFAGASWGIITKWMDTYKNWTILVLAALLSVAAAVIFRRVKKRKKS